MEQMENISSGNCARLNVFVVFEGHFLNQFVVFWAVSRHPLPWLEPYLALVLRPLALLLPTTIAYRGATAKTTNLFRAENDKHI